MPAESSPYDVLASFTLQKGYGVHIGSVVHAPLYASSQLAALEIGTAAPSGPTVARARGRQRAGRRAGCDLCAQTFGAAALAD